MWNGRVLDVEALGVVTPKPVEIEELRAGEVGFLIANIKNSQKRKSATLLLTMRIPRLSATGL